MKKLVFAFLLTTLVCAATRGETLQITPVEGSPVEPATLQEKLDMAQLVILGRVISLAPVQPEEGAMGQMTRVTYEAVVKIETLYKGAPGDGNIKVRFVKSDRPTRPQLLELRRDEFAAMFLKPGAGPFYEFITPFTGKESPSHDMVNKLEALAANTDMKAALLATMQLETAGAAAGAPVYVAARIDNTGGAPLLLPNTPAPSTTLVVSGPGGGTMQPVSLDPNAARFPLYLPPDAVYGFHADLAQYFDLSKPGAYTVTLRYAPPPSSTVAAWSGSVQSKTFGFTIY